MLSLLASAFAVLTVIAGIIAFAARTGPDAAFSNISEWIKWAGIGRVPIWLKAKAADRRIRNWSVAATLCSGLGFLAVMIWMLQESPPAKSPTTKAADVGPAKGESASEELASARLVYDPKTKAVVLVTYSKEIGNASVKKKPNSLYDANQPVIGQFVFNNPLGPYSISLSARGSLDYAGTFLTWQPFPFLVLANEDRFVELEIGGASPLIYSPFFPGNDPVDLRLSFQRMKR